jgi:general secretion pathway protein G
MNTSHQNLNTRRDLLSGRSGFTLIELVLVLTLIMILMGAGIYMVNRGGVVDSAQDTRIQSDIQAIASPLQLYEARNGRLPTTEQGLMALVEKPSKQPIPERWIALMDEVPSDPWKQPYKYRYPAQKSKKPYDIYSVGKDGADGTADDIGNWKAAEPK